MKKISQLLVVALLMVVALYSCKKKEEPAPAAPTKTELLINKKWMMTACTFAPPIVYRTAFGDFVIDDLYKEPANSFSACVKDDELNFTASSASSTAGLYTRKANEKCDGESDDSGNWNFNSNQSQVTISSTQSSSKSVFNILELTDKVFKIRTTMKNPVDKDDTKDYEATITFGVK